MWAAEGQGVPARHQPLVQHPQHFSNGDAAAQLQKEFQAGCRFGIVCVCPSEDKKSTAAKVYLLGSAATLRC